MQTTQRSTPLPSLKTRRLEPEIMDDPALNSDEHARALRGLARVHWWTGTASRLWKTIHPLLGPRTESPLRVMDVGCGDGLLLRQLASRARRQHKGLHPIGCDFSPRALGMAERAAEADGLSLELHQVDITRQQLPGVADVVLCSLFLHHFSEAEVVEILRKLAASARQLLLVEDLLRSQLGYYLCWLGVRALSRSRVVHVDGLLSVRAAFTLQEVEMLVGRAGLGQATLHPHWPERFLLHWSPRDGDCTRTHV